MHSPTINISGNKYQQVEPQGSIYTENVYCRPSHDSRCVHNRCIHNS
uniref:Uncharacterized protein n=1 Tax=Arundo donax TaxID=35708 RepID=A0A0A8Y8R4_ARUDO